MADDPAGMLTTRVARGAAWIGMIRIALRAIGFVNTLILARLLTPDDFGLVAIAVSLMQLMQNVSDIGVAQSQIRFRDGDQGQRDLLFTLSLIRGVILGGILALLAPMLAALYGDPRLLSIMLVLAGSAFIQSLINPKFFEFERDLNYRPEFIVAVTAKLTTVVISIFVAITTGSYWAIVVGVAAGSVLQTALSYLVTSYRPRLTMKGSPALTSFTGWMTGISLLMALTNKLDPLILGRLLGAGPTGGYVVGAQLSQLATDDIATPIVRASYPGMTTIRTDPERLRRGFLIGAQAASTTALPAGVGLSLVAPEVTTLLLGPGWELAATTMMVLAPIYGLMTVFQGLQGYAYAIDAPQRVFYRQAIVLSFRIPLFVVATIVFGISGALSAAAFGGVLFILLQLRLYAQLSGRSVLEPLLAVRRSIVATLMMMVAVIGVSAALPVTETVDFGQVLLKVCMGASVFFGTAFSLWCLGGRPDGAEARLLHVIIRRGRSEVGDA